MHYYSYTRIIGVGFILLATFFIVISALVAAPASLIHWHAASGGLAPDIQTLAAAPDFLYAGTWGQGIYRSTDHGATWLSANTGITLPMYVKDGLAVNSVTPTVLFAGDYYGTASGGGIYRSVDGGASWLVRLTSVNVDILRVHPITPTLVFAGIRDKGLYRSADNGDSWQVTSFPATRVSALALAASPPGTIYAGASRDLHVSINGGNSWMLASTLSSTVTSLAVHPVTPTHLYAGTRQHGLWRSVDSGTTWLTNTVTGLLANAWVTSIAIDPISPTILYAGVWQGNVYRSSDGGTFWEDLGYLGTVQDVLIYPQEPSVIYAATSSNGVFRGSTLDHLTMSSVTSPQHVYHTFPITLTARDALGFPITGATPAQLRSLGIRDSRLAATLASSGYMGQAYITDTTNTVIPTTTTFVDGIATVKAAVATTMIFDVITATIPGGPFVTSNPFNVVYAPATHFTFAAIPDQVAGESFTITITARDAHGYPVPYSKTATLIGAYPLADARDTIVLPLQVGPFEDGTWTGQLTITKAYPEMVLTAANATISGTSNAFVISPNVVAQLRLLPDPVPAQIVNEPFTLTAFTSDRFGNPSTSYTGVLTLTDSTGTLRPVTATFESGIWYGKVTITQPQNDVVITATTGNAITVTHPFDVLPVPAPVVDFWATPRSGPSPLDVQFVSQVTGTTTAYAWEFGDYFTATISDPEHIYRSSGSFGVTLVVTGPGGTASVYKPDYITVHPNAGVPTATFSANITSGTVPLDVAFTAITSGTVESWLWDFGDNAVGTSGPVITHTYTQSGTFDVGLVVGNRMGSYIVKKPKLIHAIMRAQDYIYLPVVIKGKGTQ